MTTQEGGCHCRRVRFRVSGDPKFVTRCHCDSCRRATGAAFSTWVGYPAASAAWIAGAPAFYASSPGVKRGHCADCGTPLSFESEKWPGERHFLIGAFDNPNAFPVQGDYQQEEALAFVKNWKAVE